jgi:D-alanyl-D-alanine dipeptidase
MGFDDRLVEITGVRHRVIIDLAYARGGNLTGRPIYANSCCLLRREAEPGLCRAVGLAALCGLGLKILDGYRPPLAQERLWQFLPDPRYVARGGSGNHSRGIALDLTLVDGAGEELDMGTAFDSMTESSRHFHPDLPPQEQRNRLWLLGIMTQAGFQCSDSEWWHYQLPDAGAYPVLLDDRITCISQ